mmetsp:Transcript_61215/g.182391  ORF Transcript_61215/g.182391 Transcript_61215/m.182391 type:complete len:253 (-) Transcript_61215:1108-1866(-)
MRRAMLMWQFSSVGGIQGWLPKTTASKKPRKRAANTMTRRKHMRMVIWRHCVSRLRRSSTLKCWQQPGRTRSRSFGVGSSASLSLLSDSSVSLAECSKPVRFTSRNLSRYFTNSCCVIASAVFRPVARTISSSAISWSVSSTPRQFSSRVVKPLPSNEPASEQFLSHSSLTCRRITSLSSASPASRPRWIGRPRELCWTLGRPARSHSSNRASGSVSEGILGFSTATCPERMSIIQSAGFSSGGISKPRLDR